MSSYTKSTDFASKDALLTGNPLKVVKGTEIDDEYNAIQTAINSKADTNSPALTGTPTAPTATVDTDSTQIATTAFVLDQIANDAHTEGDGIDITDGVISIDSTSNGYGVRTVSTSVPSGGSNGDIWYRYTSE